MRPRWKGITCGLFATQQVLYQFWTIRHNESLSYVYIKCQCRKRCVLYVAGVELRAGDSYRVYPALAQRQLGLAPAKKTCDPIKGIKWLQTIDGWMIGVWISSQSCIETLHSATYSIIYQASFIETHSSTFVLLLTLSDSHGRFC